MTTKTRRKHPRYADQLGKDAGLAYKGAARMQKTTADVLGWDKYRMSKAVNGKIYSPLRLTLEHVHDMVMDPKTDPGEVIAMCMLTAEQAACNLDLPELYRRVNRAACQETLFEAQEDISEMALCRAIESGDQKRIASACQDYQEAALPEMGWQLMVMVYTRAILVHYGLRAAPEGS